MKEIGSDDLAELLNGKLEGKVTFSGRVSAKLIEEDKDLGTNPYFYDAQGQFSLRTSGRDNLCVEGSYLLSCYESVFYFKPSDKKITASHPDRGGDVIAFDIDFP